MARVRDYHAEEVRRNALAKSRGFTSRAQQRHAIEVGKIRALQPKRVRSPKTRKAQERLLATRRYGPTPKAGEVPESFGGITISPEDRARDWSTMFARSEIAQYRPERAKELGVSKAKYRDAYLKAFVAGDTRYERVRHSKNGGSDALYYWFVTLNEYMEADEYESRYGPQS